MSRLLRIPGSAILLLVKVLLIVSISLSIIALSACSKSNPTAPPPPPPSKPKFNLLPYYESLDSGYFKVWSDSSWERYSGNVTLSGIAYLVTENSSGTKYYYSSGGYAGFTATNGDLIIFNHPVAPLPQYLVFDSTSHRSTTFYYAGYTVTFSYDNRLIDTTVSVSLPFGVFTPCISIASKGVISAGGSEQAVTSTGSLARNLGGVRSISSDGFTIILVRGRVGGHDWGVGTESLILHKVDSENLFSGLTCQQALNGLSINQSDL